MNSSGSLVQPSTYLATAFLRLIYPAYCAICEVDLAIDERSVCAICLQSFRPLTDPACKTCARPFPPFHNSNKRCAECKRQKLNIDSGFALFAYTETVKTLIHQAKFGRKFWLLKLFRSFMSQTSFASRLDTYDLIVPIPLDKNRLKLRGFNQSLHIAKALTGRKYNGPPLPTPDS